MTACAAGSGCGADGKLGSARAPRRRARSRPARPEPTAELSPRGANSPSCGASAGRSSSTSAGARWSTPAPPATSAGRRARRSRRRCRARGGPRPRRRARPPSDRESAPRPSPDARSRRPLSAGTTSSSSSDGRSPGGERASGTRLRRRAASPVSRIGAAVDREEGAPARRADVARALDEPADVDRAAHVLDVDHAVGDGGSPERGDAIAQRARGGQRERLRAVVRER